MSLIVSEYPDQRDRQTSPRYRLMMATTATTTLIEGGRGRQLEVTSFSLPLIYSLPRRRTRAPSFSENEGSGGEPEEEMEEEAH